MTDFDSHLLFAILLPFFTPSNLFRVSVGGPAVFVGSWAIAKGVLMLLDDSSVNKVRVWFGCGLK